MGSLYRDDLKKYSNYFDESACKHGIDVDYKYVIKRNTEEQSGESIYCELSEPIKQCVIIESGLPKVNSLKLLGWFLDEESIKNTILVDFSINTPNLQEGCRFIMQSLEDPGKLSEYVVLKISSELLYPTCRKCLCQLVLPNESSYADGKHDVDKGEISYGQRDIESDDENYSFINEKAKLSFF